MYRGEHYLLENQLTARDGRWIVNGGHLYASEGIPFAGNMDMYIANLLAGCDGKQTLRELIEAVAGQIQTDPETVGPACLATVRKLMQAGFLCSVSDLGKSTL